MKGPLEYLFDIRASLLSLVASFTAPLNTTDGGGTANTDETLLAKQTTGATSATYDLKRRYYVVSAVGLANAETVTIQIKDRVNNVYGTLVQLTASNPIAALENLPITIRVIKTATAAQVGVVLSHY